jgi:hypothetical protein
VVRHVEIPSRTTLGTVWTLNLEKRLLWPKDHATQYCSEQVIKALSQKRTPGSLRMPGVRVVVASTRLLAGRHECRGMGDAAQSATELVTWRRRAIAGREKPRHGQSGRGSLEGNSAPFDRTALQIAAYTKV